MAIVTMTQALKKLYKAVVGEDTTKNNPTKIVSDLADNYSGGASLPDVTASDNGNVLTVVEGEWAKAAAVGPEIYYVDFEWTQDYSTLTTDADFSEAVSAKNAGKLIIARIIEDDGDFQICYLDSYSYYYDEETEETEESFRFKGLSNTNDLQTKVDFSQTHFVWSNYAPIANYSTNVMLAIASS